MSELPPTRPAVIPACFFALGIGLAAIRPGPWWAWAGVTAVALGAAALTRRRALSAHLSLWLAVASFGGCWYAQHQLLPARHVAHATASSPSVMVHGVVVSDPVELMAPYREDRATFVVQAGELGTAAGWPHHLPNPPAEAMLDTSRRMASSSSPASGGHRQVVGWRGTAGLLRVTTTGVDLPVSYGDEVLLQGRLSRPAPPLRRGEFDYAAFLARRGIHAQLAVRPSDGLVRWRQGRGWPWVAAALHLKHAWRHLIDTSVPRPTQGLLAALLLGDRVALDRRLQDAFIATGTVHLLAISGFNVALLAWTLHVALGWLWVPRPARAAVVAVALGLYAIMTGGQPPVVRATVMAWVWLGGRCLERDVDLWQVLGVAVIVLLLMNPAQIGDVGFQLSFVSVAAIAYLVPKWQAQVPSSPVGRYLVQGLCVSVAAWLGVAPLVWYHFHLATPLTALANLVAVPLTEGILVLGLALGLVGWVWSELALTIGGWCHLGLSALQHFVLWCAQAPGSLIRLGQPAAWMVAAWYAALVVVAERRRLRLAEAHLALSGLAALNLLLWWKVAHP